MKITAILAMDHSRLIGKNGDLPWHIPEDLRRFRDFTTGHVVLMGKNTYFSLPEKVRPLPHRRNIVITREEIPGIETFSDIEVMREQLISEGVENSYLIGGASLYDHFFEKGLVDQVELTLIDGQHDGDIFIEEFRDDFFEMASEDFGAGKFITLIKK